MKTQSVKHFNCPVCAQPDMTDPQIDTYMYLMKLMQQVCCPYIIVRNYMISLGEDG